MKRSRSPKRLRLTGEVWREGQMYTAYCRELDLASCGRTVEETWKNLQEVFEIFLEETAKKGTLPELLEEAGLVAKGATIEIPERISLTPPRALLGISVGSFRVLRSLPCLP
jgi:predicted RNase H-like HicB family nuclease